MQRENRVTSQHTDPLVWLVLNCETSCITHHRYTCCRLSVLRPRYDVCVFTGVIFLPQNETMFGGDQNELELFIFL